MSPSADGTGPESALIEAILSVLEPRAEILEAYLFGSRARGEAVGHSDIDVAVQVRADAADAFDKPGLIADLMAALGTNAVDLVVLGEASPLLYHRVLRDGVRLLARDLRATTVREGRALSRYCDYVPQLAKIDRVLAARIARGDFGR